MQKILSFFTGITRNQIYDVIFAVCIVILFKVLSSSFAYIIVKIFKFKSKNKKDIRDSAFYQPLRLFFVVFGLYLGLWSLRLTFSMTDPVMELFRKGFWIVSTIVFAKGLAASFMPKSTLTRKLKGKNIEEASLGFVLKIVRAIIYIVAGFIVLSILGVNLNGLVAGLGIGGVIITLAAQDTAKNLFGGLVILFDKPFKVGDWIEISPYEGTVEDVTFRSTRVRTFENSVVNIPNSIIANSSIINWSKMEKRRFRVNLTVEFNTPFDKLQRFKDRAEKMLAEREAIFGDSVIVRFDEIKDNGINILISSYTNSVDYNSYLAEEEDINTKLLQILRDEDVRLAYDSKNIYIKNKQ